MDVFDYIFSWGHIDVLTYWHEMLGAGYWIVKIAFYAVVLTAIFWVLYQKWRYKYVVEVVTVGPANTVTSKMDTGRVIQTSPNDYRMRLRKSKVDINCPTQDQITPILGSFWSMGQIKIFRYGDSEYSFVPLSTHLDPETRSPKFVPSEQNLAWAEQAAKESEGKFSLQSITDKWAPTIINIILVLILCGGMIWDTYLDGKNAELQDQSNKVLERTIGKLDSRLTRNEQVVPETKEYIMTSGGGASPPPI